MATLDKDYDRVIDTLATIGAKIAAEPDDTKFRELVERWKYGASLATIALTTVDPACSIEEAFRLVQGDVQARMFPHIVAADEASAAVKL